GSRCERDAVKPRSGARGARAPLRVAAKRESLSGGLLLHHAQVAAVERQVAVVDLQAQQRQRGGHDAAALGVEAGALRAPAALLPGPLRVGALVLLGDEGVAEIGR